MNIHLQYINFTVRTRKQSPKYGKNVIVDEPKILKWSYLFVQDGGFYHIS